MRLEPPAGRWARAVRAQGSLEGYRGGAELLDAVARGQAGAWVLRPAPEHEAAAAVEAVAACLERRPAGIGRRAGSRSRARNGAGHRAGVRRPGGRSCSEDRSGRGSGHGSTCQAGRYEVVVGHPAERVRARARSGCDRGEPRVAPRPARGPRSLLPRARCGPGARRYRRRGRRVVRDGALVGDGWRSVCRPCRRAAQLGARRDRRARPRGPRTPARAGARRDLEGVPVLAAARVRDRRCVSQLRASRRHARRAGARCVRARDRSRAWYARLPDGVGRAAASDFGLRKGGQERVEEWAARAARVPVRRLADGGSPAPSDRRARCSSAGPTTCVTSGRAGSTSSRSSTPTSPIADPDSRLASGRVTTWTEAIAWARPGGRAIVQSSTAERSRDPVARARGPRPVPPRRTRAAGPRQVSRSGPRCSGWWGWQGVAEALADLGPISLLTSSAQDQTVCLLALEPGSVPAFGRAARALAGSGVITRVEAEPHL